MINFVNNIEVMTPKQSSIYTRWDDGTSNGVRLLRVDSSNQHMYLTGGSLGDSFLYTGAYRIYNIQGSFTVRAPS